MMTSSEKDRMKSLVREIECPICLEYMTADIYHCGNGHNVCGSCNSKIKTCPCCSLPITMRNRGLEKIARQLSYPCKYPGCEEVNSMEELVVHYSECSFGPLLCPMSCSFRGVLDELQVHFIIKHNTVFSTSSLGQPIINTMLDVQPKSCWDQLVASAGYMFFCSFVYSEDTFHGYVKHIGPSCSQTFVYEISIFGADNVSCFTMKNEVHRFSDLEEEIFKKSSCLMIEKGILERYLDNRKRLKTTITLRCTIEKQMVETEKYMKLGAIPKVRPKDEYKDKPKKSSIFGSRKKNPK